MTELPPPILCLDSVTKTKCFAQLLADTDEVVTMPAPKFWNTTNVDVSGLWPRSEFVARFTAINA